MSKWMKLALVMMAVGTIIHFSLPFGNKQAEAMSLCMEPFEVAAGSMKAGFTHDKEQILMEGFRKCKEVTAKEIIVEKVVLSETKVNSAVIGISTLVMLVSLALSLYLAKKKENLLRLARSELFQLRNAVVEAKKDADNLKSQNYRLLAENKEAFSSLEDVKGQLASLSPKTWEEWKKNLEMGRRFYAELADELRALQKSVALPGMNSQHDRPGTDIC